MAIWITQAGIKNLQNNIGALYEPSCRIEIELPRDFVITTGDRLLLTQVVPKKELMEFGDMVGLQWLFGERELLQALYFQPRRDAQGFMFHDAFRKLT